MDEDEKEIFSEARARNTGLRLFDDNGFDNDDSSKIEINQEYAKKFDYNKKREDLQRLEELKKKGLVEESESEGTESETSFSDVEGEDSEHLKEDLKFFDVLIKVKKGHPSMEQKDVRHFDLDGSSGEESDGVRGSATGKKKKSLYLKDVVAKHLIEEGPEFDDEKTKDVKVYDEEQEEIRKAFLEAVEVGEDDDDDGEFLKVKGRSMGEGVKDDEVERKMDEYFRGENDQLDENSKFLKEYLMNKMWLIQDSKVADDELATHSEDEALIEKQEEYEYRFQEGAGDIIRGHSRTIEGTVRKKKSSRKEQRKSKEERMEIARTEREEELKHLKNLKKEEVKEKLRRIRETAGIGEDAICLLDVKDLDEDFNPDEYDKMMNTTFGDEYYEKEDVDPEFGSDMDEEVDGEVEKPNFDEEDELLGLPKGWASCGSGDGFLEARERSLKHKVDEDTNHDEKENEEHGNERDEGKRKRKRKLSLYEKAKEAMMEEYYKLDYEDTIGDLKTRFKYAKITPNRYGLSTAEILALDEKELNQFVSLKKLAPYKEEWKMPNSTRQRMKTRTKELLRGKRTVNQKGSGKKRMKEKSDLNSLDATENEKEQQVDDSNGDKGNLTRKARRKLRQAELKLSHSRLLAYGKITSKPKKKAKH